MQTAPITLAAAGTEWLLDDTPGQNYRVSIEPGTHIAIRFGEDARKPMGRFAHANLAASLKRLHEFKHYRRKGSKFWTERPGVDLWFIFPKAAVTLLPLKGNTYVPVEIGGVRVILNVSGGSCDKGGWSDRIGQIVSALVGHPLKDLIKLAAVAVRGTDLEAILARNLSGDEMDGRQARRFTNLIAASRVPAILATRLMAGTKDLQVQIAQGYEGAGDIGTLEEISFVRGTTWRKATPADAVAHPSVTRIGTTGATRRVRSYHARFGSGRLFSITPKQVDWASTESLNLGEEAA